MKIKIHAIKDKLIPKKTESANGILLKETDILDHIEKIVEISNKHGINKCIVKGKRHLDYISEKLGINPVQGVLFSHFFERCEDNYIQISDIAESIKCSKTRTIKYMNDCEDMEKKKLIRCRRNDDGLIFYRVPRCVFDSLRNNNEYIPESIENLTVFHFFNILERIFDERRNKELSYGDMTTELFDIINLNMHLIFCKKIMSYNLDKEDLILLLCFCHLFVNRNDDYICSDDIEFLYDIKYEFSRIKKYLLDGSHTLMEGKFVVHTNNDGFVDSDSWKLSDMAKKELLVELDLKEKKNYKKNLILSDSIKLKKMFYNSKEKGEIQKLISLLSDENYLKIQERLEGKGMRKGFACLFSGPPGTGKTESVYQIARETKRNIMMVDISETKSMWFGESEKRIKEIFDTYRTAVEKSSNAPILLFNEADAVIGKRNVFSASSRSVDQTENTMQNIILQEIENLNGILIATTNLTQNMDKAFERRFLYKITFEKPCIESRKGIWNSLLPDLNDSEITEIAGKFDLSGGQIENISRKLDVDSILNGSELSMEVITQYCKDELNNGFDTEKKIGFGS